MKVAFNPVGHRTSCYTVTLPGFSSALTQHNTQEFWQIQIQMLSSTFYICNICEPFISCENIDVHISATLFSLCFPKVCEKWAQYLDIITTMIIVIALATAGLLRVCVRVRIVYRITSSSPPPPGVRNQNAAPLVSPCPCPLVSWVLVELLNLDIDTVINTQHTIFDIQSRE